MTLSRKPVASIITPTRNRADRLAVALRSMASQTFGDFEAIAVGDGSDSATAAAYGPLRASFDNRFVLHGNCAVAATEGRRVTYRFAADEGSL